MALPTRGPKCRLVGGAFEQGVPSRYGLSPAAFSEKRRPEFPEEFAPRLTRGTAFGSDCRNPSPQKGDGPQRCKRFGPSATREKHTHREARSRTNRDDADRRQSPRKSNALGESTDIFVLALAGSADVTAGCYGLVPWRWREQCAFGSHEKRGCRGLLTRRSERSGLASIARVLEGRSRGRTYRERRQAKAREAAQRHRLTRLGTDYLVDVLQMHRNCFENQGEIAKHLGCHRKSIPRLNRQFEELGIIERERLHPNGLLPTKRIDPKTGEQKPVRTRQGCVVVRSLICWKPRRKTCRPSPQNCDAAQAKADSTAPSTPPATSSDGTPRSTPRLMPSSSREELRELAETWNAEFLRLTGGPGPPE